MRLILLVNDDVNVQETQKHIINSAKKNDLIVHVCNTIDIDFKLNKFEYIKILKTYNL